MRRRRTKRYETPKIDLNRVKLPKLHLPNVDFPTPKMHLPKVNLPWKQVVVLGVLVILTLTMLNLNTRLSEYTRLSGDRDTLSTQVGGLRATKMALETQLAYVGSDSAVVGPAREAHMLRDGEKLIIVLTPGNNVIATPETNEEKISLPQPWEIWAALFFGR